MTVLSDIRSRFNYHEDPWRVGGQWPVADCLRPAPNPRMQSCPVFTRLPAPKPGRTSYRHYHVTDTLTVEDAYAVACGGEA